MLKEVQRQGIVQLSDFLRLAFTPPSWGGYDLNGLRRDMHQLFRGPSKKMLDKVLVCDKNNMLACLSELLIESEILRRRRLDNNLVDF